MPYKEEKELIQSQISLGFPVTDGDPQIKTVLYAYLEIQLKKIEIFQYTKCTLKKKLKQRLTVERRFQLTVNSRPRLITLWLECRKVTQF